MDSIDGGSVRMRNIANAISLYRRANKKQVAFLNKVTADAVSRRQVDKIKAIKMNVRAIGKDVFYIYKFKAAPFQPFTEIHSVAKLA